MRRNAPDRRRIAWVVAFAVAAIVAAAWVAAIRLTDDESASRAGTTARGERGSRIATAPASPGVGPIEPAPIGRHSVVVAGVPFSFDIRQPGWERFGGISINKSIRGPQGAEAIIFWTGFPDDDRADPCPNVSRAPVGPSAADLAARVAMAPGTELLTRPSDVAVGGRAATQVVLVVREGNGCQPGFFHTWDDVRAGSLWSATSVGDTVRVWVVEVGGTRLFIEAETSTDADDVLESEVLQIVESIRFDERALPTTAPPP